MPMTWMVFCLDSIFHCSWLCALDNHCIQQLYKFGLSLIFILADIHRGGMDTASTGWISSSLKVVPETTCPPPSGPLTSELYY
ncbi:hypothetical protein EV421DRAFT_1850336 [Armillaria borealis]|uniref:Secreted protein n=1 Tax=Armillaria borealis TaxID=47425 RepID=A0AA39IZS8_9AGAR|nr:hypothetical protein EV421DRAFT_1850336 [Armillaria borealis]